MGRESRCAECGASVLITQARAMFRDGAMVLVCDGCVDGGDDADYDELYVSLEEDSDEIYAEVEVSVTPPDKDPAAPPSTEGVIYGTDDAAVSGAIDVDR